MNEKEFRERYKQNVRPINPGRYQESQQPRMYKAQEPIRYTASKGTASRAKKNRKNMKTRIAAMLLAATVGIGAISLANHNKVQNSMSVAEMQQAGVSIESLGLEEETIAQFEKYDEYFAQFNQKQQYDLTDEQVLSMISEIRQMHFSVVKEKIGNMLGEKEENIKMYYNFDNSDGNKVAKIVVNEDVGDKITFKNDMLSTSKKIPKELANTIWQLDSLDDISVKLKSDKLTKVNAIKEIKKIYESLEKIATGNFEIDKKQNISIDYDMNKQIEKRQQEGRNERD